MKGNVTFDVPTTTFDGTPAEGNVAYKISINGKSELTGTTTYGAHAVVPVTLPQPDDYTFRVSLNNEAGVSPVQEMSAFIGVGVPKAPVVKTERANGKVEISWQPVTEVTDKGYIDPAGVVYNVQRFPDKVMVAEGISTTSCTDVLPQIEDLEFYYYIVTALYGGAESAAAKTESFMCGTAKVPYYHSFLGKDDLLGYTIVDANNDEKTWTPAMIILFVYGITPTCKWTTGCSHLL